MLQPVFSFIDNVASKAYKKYLEEEHIKLQLVQPHNHRVNASELPIQTFKNHKIVGLNTCDKKFPSVRWCKLIKEGQ